MRRLTGLRNTYWSLGLMYNFLLEAAAVLVTFVHLNHIGCLYSRGLTQLPSICNSKLFGDV
ncbi:hypothetical protein DLR74_06015 [Vibrio paracholerae]|nr:hypothetical protein DLR68_07980 [Vibrio paracholerae]RBM90243.1 hypothetical protein DLR74_06015 [Vibrio paracholerae]